MKPRHATLFFCVALLAMLAGCVHAPKPEIPALGFDVPNQWGVHGGQEGGVEDNWWESLDDPVLDELIGKALGNNPDLAAASARVEIALAESRIAGADLYPQLQGGLNASRNRTNITVTEVERSADPSAEPTITKSLEPLYTNAYGLSLDLGWEIDLWGRMRSETKASRAALQATLADYAAAQLSLSGQVAKVWFTLTESRLQVALTERTVETYRETARQASDRVEEGIQPPGDKYLALSNLASAEGALALRRATLERVQRQLETLLGEYPSGLLEGAGDLPGVPSPPPVGIPAQLIGRRPDLIAAERRLAAADSRLSASRAALYPRISLTASGGTASEELGDLLSAERVVWTILGNLVQPIFQGGRLLAQVDARAGRKAEAIATFAQQALGAFSEVEQALAVDSLLATREEALRRSAQNAEEAVVIAQNRYAQGIENLIVVLESQRRALDARSAWLAVRRERLENRIDLHLALGGGFNVPASATDIPSSKGPKQ